MMIKTYSYAGFFTLLLSLSACTYGEQPNITIPNETNIEFVKRYVNAVDANTSGVVFKSYWGERANQYVLNEPEKISREIRNSAAMHNIVIKDNTLTTVPEVNEWNDPSMTVSFMFTLNQPVTLSLPGYPKSGDSPWTGYQITVEKENDNLVVSGESLSR